MSVIYIITLALQLTTLGILIYDIIKDKYIENCSKEILDAVAGIERRSIDATIKEDES